MDWEVPMGGAYPDLEILLKVEVEPRIFPPYQSHHQWHEHEKILVLHSSGTTGPSKPVYSNAGALAVLDSIKRIIAPKSGATCMTSCKFLSLWFR